MNKRIAAAGLAEIDDKLRAQERLAFEDGVRLFNAPDLLAVGWLANREREKRHEARTFFNYNLRLEPTNVCVASCLFCSFARLQPHMPEAYTMSLEQAWDKLRQRANQPLTELHIVNGLNPDLPFSYYKDLLRGFKQIRPGIHLKCFTAVEIAYFADLFNNRIRRHHQSPSVLGACKSPEARNVSHGRPARFPAETMDSRCACSSTSTGILYR